MSPPTLGDLRAEHFWGMHALHYGRMLASLPTVVNEEEAHGLKGNYFISPSIAGVTSLVKSHYPGLPTPALDAVWLTKGVRGTQADLRVYWEDERMKEMEQRADAAAVILTSSPSDAHLPLAIPPSILEPHKVEHYVPNRAELYGYEMWWRDELPSFATVAQAQGTHLSLAQLLDPYRTKWSDASFPMIMALTKLQFPGHPTPSFDQLWRKERGIWATKDDLLEFWRKLATGEETLELLPSFSDPAQPSASPGSETLQNVLSTLRGLEASIAAVIQRDQAQQLELPSELLELKEQLSKLSLSLERRGGSSIADWTDVVSDRSSNVAGQAFAPFSVG